MKPSNTRGRDVRREPSQSRPARRTLFPSIFRLPRMPTIFNITRASVYLAVLIWTVICLGIAAHFQSILMSSDLTRFVPFAIFVCSASLLIFVALLSFSFWRDRNPISTRIELGCLGLAGVLWLALSAFVASSESEEADVECYSSSNAEEVIEVPGFNTETFHAQYRVLEAFSFFNVILIWGFFLLLLFLAIRQYRHGQKRVWFASVTAFPWFGKPAKQMKLPAPVVARSKSRSRAAGVPVRVPTQERRRHEERRHEEKRYDEKRYDEKPSPPIFAERHTPPMGERRSPPTGERRAPPTGERRSPPTEPLQRRPSRNEEPTFVYWMPHKELDQAHVRDHRAPRASRDKYYRNASPRR